MKTYLYQIDESAEEQGIDAATMVVIVEEQYFRQTGGLASDHILEDIVADTGLTALEDHFDELQESMFACDLDADAVRALLNPTGVFKEEALFD